MLALLLFRLVWGFVGGRWSRFAAFIYSPGSVMNYLRGRAHPDHLIGHTPLGALSVFALLAILALQVATGLVADDEIAASGPLTRFVSSATVEPGHRLAHRAGQVDRDRAGRACTCWRCCSTCSSSATAWCGR